MTSVAPAILYALFVWWFSTGIVLLLVLRRRSVVRVGLCTAAMVFPACLLVLAKSSAQASVTSAYVAFTAAIVLWGTQEMAFLAGVLTGPRPLPCPPGAAGLLRVRYAIASILYHELALALSGLAVAVVSFGGANQTGPLTFAVLWTMRVSAKLNLFLGVPVLNDGFMPAPIAYARSYFRRKPVGAFFHAAMVLSGLATCALVGAAVEADAGSADRAGDVLVASLLGLAMIEHLFMVVSLPIDKLWAWSRRGTAMLGKVGPSRAVDGLAGRAADRRGAAFASWNGWWRPGPNGCLEAASRRSARRPVRSLRSADVAASGSIGPKSAHRFSDGPIL